MSQVRSYSYRRGLAFNRFYEPIVPQADDETIAAKGDRLILRHHQSDGPDFHIAPRNEVHSGWVVGIFETT